MNEKIRNLQRRSLNSSQSSHIHALPSDEDDEDNERTQHLKQREKNKKKHFFACEILCVYVSYFIPG